MLKKLNISKSTFIRGLQCDKSLYLKKYQPQLEDKVSEAQQAIFDSGHEIGSLATKLFPGGVDLNEYIPKQMSKVFRDTKTLMSNREIIYEAGFSYDNLICFSDILVPKGNKWLVYEVKGSTEVKEVYRWDAAFQYYLITNSGIEVEDISIIHINNQYERVGELELDKLFTITSVKDKILPLQPLVMHCAKEFKSMLSKGSIPDIDIGPHCTDPYGCSFMGHCWNHIPEYSVFNISRLTLDKKFELYDRGILEVTDVPDDYPLSSGQQLQVKAERTGETFIDKEAIKDFVDSLNYPLYFLDFETFNPTIPKFDHSRPFQQIVFQYSLHVLDKPGGELIHKEFLAEADDTDPRIPFIERLIEDIDNKGDIIVYNKGFETARLNEIGRDFPEYQAQVLDINSRVVDLMTPFSKKHYYSPEMKGSYSIKMVLPALVPDLSYEGMEIADGGAASSSFMKLFNESDPVIIKKTREDLLKYCKLDTLAMVEILNVIKR